MSRTGSKEVGGTAHEAVSGAREDDVDADPGDGRDETVSQRMDRNWIELLQQLDPVSLHRALFRRHAKARLVAASNVLLRAVLLGVALVLAGTVVLIFDVVAGFRAACVAGALSVLVLAALTCLPLLVRAEAHGPET
jgi:hypothetical protein